MKSNWLFGQIGEKNGTWSPLQRSVRLPILELSDAVLSVTAGKKCQKTRYSRQKTSKMRIVGQYSRLKIKAQCFEQCFSNHFTVISNLISDYYWTIDADSEEILQQKTFWLQNSSCFVCQERRCCSLFWLSCSAKYHCFRHHQNSCSDWWWSRFIHRMTMMKM